MSTESEIALTQDEVTSIKKFINLDNNLKKSRKEIVEARKVLAGNKDRVIDLMLTHELPKLDLNNGKMVLQIKPKIKKVKPTKDEIICRIGEAIKSGNAENMSEIYKEIYKPTEVNDGWTLYRRTKKTPKKKPSAKKVKITQ